GGYRPGGGPGPELAGRWGEGRRLVGVWSQVWPWENSAKEEKGGERRACPEAVCGGGGREKITGANGNHTIPGRDHRVGVTSDGAESAPRLRVTYGEDAKESKPPLKSPSRDTHRQRSE